MTKEQEKAIQEKFENFVRKETNICVLLTDKSSDGQYKFRVTYLRWLAWKAAWEEAIDSLPEVPYCGVEYDCF